MNTKFTKKICEIFLDICVIRKKIWTDLKVCPYWKEVIKRLEDYKKELQKEILGVERRIEELKM